MGYFCNKLMVANAATTCAITVVNCTIVVIGLSFLASVSGITTSAPGLIPGFTLKIPNIFVLLDFQSH